MHTDECLHIHLGSSRHNGRTLHRQSSMSLLRFFRAWVRIEFYYHDVNPLRSTRFKRLAILWLFCVFCPRTGSPMACLLPR